MGLFYEQVRYNEEQQLTLEVTKRANRPIPTMRIMHLWNEARRLQHGLSITWALQSVF